MNIIISDSWLREYLQTKATVKQIAEYLTLCSQSVEKITKVNSDFLYEIEITTNRPDCLSVYGIARELAAILPQFGMSAKLKPIKEGNKIIPKLKKCLLLKVEIKNKNLCPRFTALIFDNIKIKSSPKIVQERLEKSGIRALNNVVDISNYLMLELGQPMHTFDYDKIKGAKMILRESAGGEKITTLDGQIRPLPDGAIIIEDNEGHIIDLCGIMGGNNSAVDDHTQRVLLFVQTYNPMKIRQTSQKIAFRTEASNRFEKGVDPEGVILAIKKAIVMFENNCQAKIASNLIDIYPNPPKRKKVTLKQEKLNQVIGINFDLNLAAKILKNLGFNIKPNVKDNTLTAGIPHWRIGDINITEDLIEEVARIYGYHKLPSVLPAGEIPPTPENLTFNWEDKIKNLLKNLGFTETVSYSLICEELLKKIAYQPKECLKIANPLTQDWVYLRPALIPSILEVIKKNQAIEKEFRVFEMANVYLPVNNFQLPDEILTLTASINNNNFFYLKGILELILKEMGINNYEFNPYRLRKTLYGKNFSTQQVAEIIGKKNPLGVIGEISPLILRRFGIKDKVSLFELDFQELTKQATTFKKYQPVSKYPEIVEDLSLVVQPQTEVGKIIQLIKQSSPIIQKVELLDSYKNTRTFQIAYQSRKKTLTNKEIEIIRKKIIKAVNIRLNCKFINSGS